MKARSRLILTTMTVMLLLLSSSSTRAHAFTNGQSASLVIGQKDFISNTGATSQSGLNLPIRVVFDSSGNMWVSEEGNNRLLEFKPPFSTDMPASLVIGQPNFTSGTPALTQSGFFSLNMGGGLGFGFDSSDNLWVADFGNNRVLEFKTPFSTGMAASLVIGQKNFTAGNAGGSKDGLLEPSAVAFDHSDNLWVLDQSNNRVLEFQPPFSNGMSASMVIGQANFETFSSSTTQNGLSGGIGSDLTIDSSGNIWVGDSGNNRVLEFKPPFSNGMNAFLVIGQMNFATGNAPVASGSSFGQCCATVTFDLTGNLWVGDLTDNRLLEFQPPFSNGMSASLVIGQKNFTTSTPSTTQDGLSDPAHLGFDRSGNLWVPDVLNNRVLEFSATPVPEFPTASLAIVAMVSLAVVAVVSRRFSLRRLDG